MLLKHGRILAQIKHWSAEPGRCIRDSVKTERRSGRRIFAEVVLDILDFVFENFERHCHDLFRWHDARAFDGEQKPIVAVLHFDEIPSAQFCACRCTLLAEDAVLGSNDRQVQILNVPGISIPVQISPAFVFGRRQPKDFSWAACHSALQKVEM